MEHKYGHKRISNHYNSSRTLSWDRSSKTVYGHWLVQLKLSQGSNQLTFSAKVQQSNFSSKQANKRLNTGSPQPSFNPKSQQKLRPRKFLDFWKRHCKVSNAALVTLECIFQKSRNFRGRIFCCKFVLTVDGFIVKAKPRAGEATANNEFSSFVRDIIESLVQWTSAIKNTFI